MDSFVDERDRKILENDKYTFFVLRRIMDAEAYINSGNMYLWKNEPGKNVASCKFAPDENMASINLVFTRPEFRRKHYAENLVYQVTKLAMSAGYVPMLYTDANYAASNACYEKIGYVLRGKLCTIDYIY